MEACAPFCLELFCTPPTGAAVAAGRPVERRGPLAAPRRAPEERCVDKISSRDWSNLPDMVVAWSGGQKTLTGLCCRALTMA